MYYTYQSILSMPSKVSDFNSRKYTPESEDELNNNIKSAATTKESTSLIFACIIKKTFSSDIKSVCS